MSRENTGRWKRLRKEFLASLTDFDCSICGEFVDTDLSGSEAYGPTVDHIRSVKHYPDLEYEPSNLALAHRVCNQHKYDKPEAKLPEQTVRARYWSRYDPTFGWVRVGCGTVQWSSDHQLINYENGKAVG